MYIYITTTNLTITVVLPYQQLENLQYIVTIISSIYLCITNLSTIYQTIYLPSTTIYLPSTFIYLPSTTIYLLITVVLPYQQIGKHKSNIVTIINIIYLSIYVKLFIYHLQLSIYHLP